MRKLLFAASALVLAAAMGMPMVSQSQAAPARSPYCAMAKAQKNPVSWNAFYHCLSTGPQMRHVALRRHHGPVKNPFCKYAGSQKNLVGWATFYHCW